MSTQREECKHFSNDEVVRLLDAAKHTRYPLRNQTILKVSYIHGLRASEVGLLKLNDVNLSDRRIYVRRLKDSKAGYHPIQHSEYKSLSILIKRQQQMHIPYLFTSNEGHPINRVTLHKLIKQCADIAGIENAHFHMLRHSCGVHMALKNIPTVNIMDWLGHRSIKNTQIYTQAAASMMNEELVADCWAI